jgi:hypothetical protein
MIRPRVFTRRAALGALGLSLGSGCSQAVSLAANESGATLSTGDVSAPRASDPNGPLVARTATNYDAMSVQANAHYSIGQAFAPGAIPSGYRAEMRLSDGVTVIATQQANNRATHADGSLKFANFIWKHPNAIAAGASDMVKFYAVSGAYSDTTAITTAPITAQDYKVEMVVGGATYTFSVNTGLAGTKKRQVRSGAACAAWYVWGDLLNGSTPQGSVWVECWVYVYSDGTMRVYPRVRASKIQNSDAISVTSLAFKNGSTALRSWPDAFTFYYGTIVDMVDADGLEHFSGDEGLLGATSTVRTTSKVVWTFPRCVLSDPTTTGLYDAKLVHWYEWNSTQIAGMTDWTPYDYAPLAQAEIVQQDGPGGSEWIGPLPRSSVQAMLRGSYLDMRYDREQALAGLRNQCWFKDFTTAYTPPFNGKSAGTYPSLPADASTVSWCTAATFSLAGGNPTNTATSAGHLPHYFYFQYLATGYEWWGDLLFEQANAIMGQQNPGDASYCRNYTTGGMTYHGVSLEVAEGRHFAWFMRTVSDAQWVCPDSHALKQYLADVTTTNYNAFVAYLAANSSWAALGIWKDDYDGSSDKCYVAPWMHDYFMLSVAMDIRRGNITASHGAVQNHIIPWVLGRVVNGSYYRASGIYNMSVFRGPNPSFYGGSIATDWSQVYIGAGPSRLTFPLIDGNSAAGANPPGIDMSIDNDLLSVWEPFHSYPVILQCAAASAQVAGINTADQVYAHWRSYETAHPGQESGNIGNTPPHDWAHQPHWRIRVPS